MRVGLVGAGYFARFQIRAWNRLPGARLVAVADLDPARRDEGAALAAGAKPVADLEAVLSDAPDLLDIATPPDTHAAMIRAALGRVPAIICQKPFCRDLAEARAVTAAAEAAGATLMIHENFRFQPWYRETARLLAAGRLGAAVQARFALRPGDGAGSGAYLDRQPYFREMPRFLIRETGIHFIDTFRFLFGEPVAVYADLRRTNPVIAGEDTGLVILDFASGTQAVLDGNRTLDHAARNRRLTMGEFELEGTAATLRLTGDGAILLRARGTDQWVTHPYTVPDVDFGGDCVHAFQAHALAALRGEGPCETRARDYLRNLQIEAAVYRSAESLCKIRLWEDSE